MERQKRLQRKKMKKKKGKWISSIYFCPLSYSKVFIRLLLFNNLKYFELKFILILSYFKYVCEVTS